jgi:hypothetical protein
LFDASISAIRLYVQLSKDKLILQAEVDVAQEVDMCIKVKQLGANMQLQVAIVLRLFLDFMDSFKLLALMLDPQFKDLSVMGNYMLARLLQLRLQVHMIPSSSSQLLRLCSRNCMDS